MGVVSAGVMYLSAFVFVDRLNIHPVTDDRRMVEEEKEEEGGMSGSAFSPVGRGGFGQNVQQSYFPTPMANLYSSPLPSPTTPYRPPPTTSDLRKGHPPYSGVPGSSLRASIIFVFIVIHNPSSSTTNAAVRAATELAMAVSIILVARTVNTLGSTVALVLLVIV
ncbi:hypothetical protein [Sporisorium scitamineum]|uniref:Uncharacterized protein n=1 Tax=Sporisorium scitamineum TaxID=49012 RepID=A0A0F7RT06_9BASI|nr:hypothetical protein [Sporisorium scitamineum]